MTRRLQKEGGTMDNVFVFVLLIIGMGIVSRWGHALIKLFNNKSQWKKENQALKQELEGMQNEMAALRQRFDSQYANVTLALDDLRKKTAAQLQLPDEQRKRETLQLKETRRE